MAFNVPSNQGFIQESGSSNDIEFHHTVNRLQRSNIGELKELARMTYDKLIESSDKVKELDQACKDQKGEMLERQAELE